MNRSFTVSPSNYLKLSTASSRKCPKSFDAGKLLVAVFLTFLSLSAFGQAEPANHVTGFAIGTRTTTSLELTWTGSINAPAPEFYLIVAKTGAGTFPTVADTDDFADDLFSGVDVTGQVNVAHAVGANSYIFTGLQPNTQYDFRIYPYKGASPNKNYKVDGTIPEISGTTFATEPTANPSGLVFSAKTHNSVTLTWDAIGTPVGSGTDRIVVVNLNSSASVAPADGTTYAANTAYGSGGTTGTDNYVVYKGTGTSVNVTNLVPNTTYKFSVISFNGSGGSENYFGAGSSQTSTLTPQITNVAFSTPAANTPIKVGTATVTITVASDLGAGAHTLTSGTVAGRTLTNLQRVNNTTYTADISIVDGSASTAAGDDIPVTNLVLTNVGGAASAAYAQTISQPNDGIDASIPTVLSSNYLTPGTSPTNATTLIFRVTFSESVTGVAAGNFTATFTNGLTGDAPSVTGSGAQYDVTIANITGATTGTVRLDVDNTPAVTDAGGNAYAVNFSSGQVYTVDYALPVFSAVAPATSAFVNSTRVSYTLSEAIASGTITWLGTSGPDNGNSHVQVLNAGAGELSSGAHSNILLNSPPTLLDGSVYTVTFDGVDAAGNNAADVVSTSVTYDVSPPTNQNTVYAVSSTVLAGSSVTIVSSGDATNEVWFAPAGTLTFAAGPTMTKAVDGTSTSILAPATSGDYKLFVIDRAGNISTASTATLTSVAAPTVAPSAVNFTNVSSTSITVNWTNGNGQRRLVIAREGAGATNTDPTNFTAYTASNDFNNGGAQTGSVIGNGNVVYDGTGSSFTYTNLTTPGTYQFSVYEYNGTSTTTGVFNMTQATGSQITFTQATNIVLTSPTSTSFSVAWTNGTGSNRILLVKTAGSTFSPVNGQTYSANGDFSAGSDLDGTGETVKCIFNGPGTSTSVSNLSSGTSYIFQVYEYTGSGASTVYTTVTATNNPVTQATISGTEPTSDATARTWTAISQTSMTFTVTGPGNGANRMVVISPQDISWDPTDGTSYTANTDFSAGTDVDGGGNTVKVIGFGNGPHIVTGLSGDTRYRFGVFEFNGTQGTGAENYYLTEDEHSRNTEPTAQPTALNFTNTASSNSMTLNWTDGNGDRRLVLVKENAPVDAVPVDLTAYTASTNWSSKGTQIGTGNYVVYASSGSNVALTNLTAGATYHFAIFEYNSNIDGTATDNTTSAAFLTASPATAAIATEPTTAATTNTYTNITGTSITFTVTGAGNGSNRMVVVSPQDITINPIDGTSYTANTDFSAGTDIDGGGNVVKVVGFGNGPHTVTGLSGDTRYRFAVFEFHGTQGTGQENYFHTEYESSRNTEPTLQAVYAAATSVTVSGMQVNWIAGNGDRVLVLAKFGAPVDATPTDYTMYTESANWASKGTEIGTGNYVIFDGDDADLSVTLTNLQAGTYHFAIFSYNANVDNNVNTNTGQAAFLTPAATGSQATLTDATAPTQLTTGTVTSVGGTLRSGYYNSTNTSINVVVPLTNSDPTLDLGTIRLQMKQSAPGSTSFSNFGGALDVAGSGYVTITAADRQAGTKTVSLSDATLQAHADFDEGATFQIRAVVTDYSGNPTNWNQSAQNMVRDETLPTTGTLTFTSNGSGSDETITWLFSEDIDISGDGTTGGDTGGAMTGFSIANGGTSGIGSATYEFDPSPGSPTDKMGWLISAVNSGQWTANTTVSYSGTTGNILDLAGNEMADFNNAGASDVVAPFLVTGMVFNPNGTGNETITFRLSEPLQIAEGAVLGFKVNQPIANTTATGVYSGKNTTETITLTSPSDGAWTDAIRVSYVQADGNVTDAIPNEMAAITDEYILLQSINISSNNALNPTTQAKLGDVISLTFTVATGRTLSTDPTVTIGGQTAVKDGSVIAPNYKYDYNTTPDVLIAGNVAISITADETGPPAKTTVTTATTNSSAITYDKTAPTAPSLPDLAAADDTGPGVGADSDNYTTSSSDLDFSGTAEANSTVRIYNGVDLIGVTTASAGGAWSITCYTAGNPESNGTLADGTHSITATATDAAGNISVASSTLTLVVDNTPPVVLSIAVVSPPTVNSWSTTNGTSASTVTFRVTFDEPVTGLDYSGGGGGGGSSSFRESFTSEATLSGFSGPTSSTLSAPYYVDVTVTGISGTGKLAIDYLDKDNVVNLVGDPVGGAGSGNGDFITDLSPVSEYYTIVLQEPSNSVTGFSSSVGTTQVNVFWSNVGAPATQATHYLVRLKKSSSTFTPVTFTDGIPGGAAGHDGQNWADTDFSDGTLANIVTYPTAFTSFTGLTSGQQYNIEIYPLTQTSGQGVDNWNYKFSAPLTGNATTTTAANGAVSFVSATSSISSMNTTLTGAIAPQENAVSSFQFTISDDNGVPNNDNADFKFSQIVIREGTGGTNYISNWSQAIESASLSDGVNTVTVTNAAVANTTSPNNTITFPVDPATLGLIADNTGSGSSKTYTLRIALKTSLGGTLPANIDGKNFEFRVDATSFSYDNTGTSSSTLAPASTQESGDANNVVNVLASKLRFHEYGPSLTATDPQAAIGVKTNFGQSSAAQPQIYALDANNNWDIGYNATYTIGATETFVNSAPANFIGGKLTLSNFNFTSSGSTTITVSGNAFGVYGALTAADAATSTSVNAVISNKTTISDGAIAPGSELASFPSTRNAVELSDFNFDFTITDDVGANATTYADNDNLPTLIETITIAQHANNGAAGADAFDDWTKTIAGAELSDGTNSVTVTNPSSGITATSLVFNVSGTLGTVSEGSPKTYRLRIWLLNPVDATLRDVLDNKDFAFSINQSNVSLSVAPDASSTLAASSATTGDGRNVVTVTASQVDFITQWLPGAIQNYDAALDADAVTGGVQSATLKARDANQNLDTDFGSAISVVTTNSLTYPLANHTGMTFASGQATLNSNIQVTSAGNGTNNASTRLIVSSGGLSSENSFPCNDFTLTYSSASTITRESTDFAYPTNILYASVANQTSDITGTTGVSMERFTVKDGGASADADGTSTKMSSVTIRVTNYHLLRRIALYEKGASPYASNNEITELDASAAINVSGNTADFVFSGITTFEAPDNGNRENNFEVKVSFKSSTIINFDNSVLTFEVVAVSAAAVSSSFADATPDGTVSSVSSNQNKIEVVATAINISAPATASVSVPISVTAYANDANGNLDADYNGTITLTGTNPALGFTTSSNPSGAFTAGVKAYPGAFQFDAGNGNVQLTMTSGAANTAGASVDAGIITGSSNTISVISSFESGLYGTLAAPTTTDIPYINYQEDTDITSETMGYTLQEFTLNDGGMDPDFFFPGDNDGDADGAPTILQDLTLGVSNPQAIRRIAIWQNNGGTWAEVDEQSGSAINITSGFGQITFTGLNITAADAGPGVDGLKTFRVIATFNDTHVEIQDNAVIQISVIAAVLDNGSKFYPDGTTATTIGGYPKSNLIFPAAATSISAGFKGAYNRIEVTATSLDFEDGTGATSQPSPIAGRLQPIDVTTGGNTGIVYARDKYAVLDTDFNYTATVSAPANPSGNLTVFSNGQLDLDGLEYQTAGVGTLTVIANSINSQSPNPADNTEGNSEPCITVDVLHTTAVHDPTNPEAVAPAVTGPNLNGVDLQKSLKGGTGDKRIFGVTFTAQHETATEPELEEFSIIFRDDLGAPYPYTKGTTSNIFKNFKLAMAIGNGTATTLTAGTDYTLYQEQTVALTATGAPAEHKDKLRFVLTTPAKLYENDYKFYLNVDIDVNVSVGTAAITPYVVDLGYNNPNTNSNILTSAGSSSTVEGTVQYVKGVTRKFASTKPPVLVSTTPTNGKLNVDPALNLITMKFDVPVVSFDGKIQVWNRETGTLRAEFTSVNGKWDPLGGALASQVVSELIFQAPVGFDFKPDTVYYVTVEKGVFSNTDPTQRKGISDEGYNLFGGISYNGTFYFKGSSTIAPALSGTDATKYSFTPTSATFNFKFNKAGKVHYMVVDPAGAPTTVTNDQILGTTAYTASTIIARGTTNIDQYDPNFVYTTINASLTNGTNYFVFAFAENDAEPTPVKTTAPYGADFAVGSTGPTFKITKTAANTSLLSNPRWEVCVNSSVKMEEPIIISELGNGNFAAGFVGSNTTQTVQSFNLLLPSGFQFDVTKDPVIALNSGSVNGGDFGTLPTNTKPFRFRNSALLEINFVNGDADNLDNIVISNLYIIASAADQSGNIVRFGGNGLQMIADDITLARIVSGAVTPTSFTNSYDEAFSPWPYPEILPTKIVTYIPDNFSTTVKLIPEPADGDYGASFFTGSGLTNDELTLSAVTPDAAFNITLTHTDQNGCSSSTIEQYLVYDHTSAIAELLETTGTTYYVNETKVGLIPGPVDPSTNVPGTPAPTKIVADEVSYQGLAGYQLVDLYSDIPVRAKTELQFMDYNNAGWMSLVNGIVEVKALFPDPLLGQTFKSYNWEYSDLINKTSIDAAASSNSVTMTYPYDPVNSPFAKTVRSAGTANGQTYFVDGSLGVVEFTGVYQSTADYSVFIPFRQEVEVFIPAVPIVEVTGQSSMVGSTAIFCENGNTFTITGYPDANSSDVTGFFTLYDSAAYVDPLIAETAITNPGFVDNGNGTATFNPTIPVLKNSYQTIAVVYTYQNNESPAIGKGVLYIRVTPNPVADFTTVLPSPAYGTTMLCEGQVITFQDQSPATGATGIFINQWDWKFADPAYQPNDPANTSTAQQPTHTYMNPGRYGGVSLDVWTNVGCKSVAPTIKTLDVGERPNVNFSLTGFTATDSVTFRSTSTFSSPLFDKFARLDWSYDRNDNAATDSKDYTPAQTANPTDDFVNEYPTAGIYSVKLTVTSEIGCIDSLRKEIVVVPRVSGEYHQRFEDANHGWQVFGIGGYNRLKASWTRGAVNKTHMQMQPNNEGFVMSTTDDTTGLLAPNERSALYTPSFDLRSFDRPMISFNSFVDFLGADGVIIQFSLDDKNPADPTKSWHVLGEGLGEGVQWFNTRDLTNNPGQQADFKFGWSLDIDKLLGEGTILPEEATKWLESKHAIDAGLINGQALFDAKRVIFRFALAADVDVDEVDGFALDNFRLGERTRYVLVENFTNTGNETTLSGRTQTVELEESEFISTTFGTNPSIIRMDYHVGFPQQDPFNLDNPADPGARGLYYNISKTPRVRMDGVLPENVTDAQVFSEWGVEQYSKQSLKLADADIDATVIPNTDGTISIDVTVDALRDLPANTILFVAVVERNIALSAIGSKSAFVKTGQTEFEYVFKRMLPNAAGTRFNTPLLTNDPPRSFPRLTWTDGRPLTYDPTGDLVAVIFLQDEDNRNIYQSVMELMTEPTLPTGIEDPELSRIAVYPNPADRELIIQLPQVFQTQTEMQMFDQMGKRVEQSFFERGVRSKAINTSQFAAGVYVIQVNTPNGLMMKKVVITHSN